MRLQEPRWARYVDAAVGGSGAMAPNRRRGRLRRELAELRRRLAAAHEEQAASQEHLRPDVRLLPTVAGVWLTAALATAVPGGYLPRLLPGLVLLSVAVPFFLPRRKAGRRGKRRGATFILAGCCALAVVAVVGLRAHAGAASALAQTVASDGSAAVTLEVVTSPRSLQGGNGPPRLMFEAVIIRAAAGGREASGRLPVQVIAGQAWGSVRQGQVVGTAGAVELGAAQGGKQDAGRIGTLRPATRPLPAVGSAGSGPLAVAAVRSSWIAAANGVWAEPSPDTAALLPGMVMGERSGMPASLNDSMKAVGLTHLTAVSGANCTLILATIMLGLRSLRTPRHAAFAVSLAALLGFVLVVGPDPSVLRAAVMGGLGAMALLSGRPKRVGALLSVSIVLLLLADPWLAADFAFILSVLATLGLYLVGQRCVRWLSVLMPLWLAQTIAIPLAAQLFCAPVIVLLQARLTPYTVPANMLAAPVIALVTTVGTLGMACAVVVPPLASLCAAVSGAGAWWVAAVARWMSALPAASLPWPEGMVGAVLMAVMNAAVLLALLAFVERQRAAAAMRMAVGWLPPWWRRRFGFATLAALAMVVAAGWCAAVVML
ncbi:competence protein ComEC [Arthrobacter stackebrandtii]|uniref:Competence protein ComEC n=1 Tax=Arthrobacter stackebrandtii TaxID=272161 RepID=A0ABS4Z053_9MICC|nr:ComEC/Rec2 family competence protein [Arthrobacter stackebrandtii]MBP2414431.1 competence protein ComEC [Arthrobacter stackebrandtii]PYH01559.1 hypothetical protein CVV67_03550 [Arthrobacter stackebrandtii]